MYWASSENNDAIPVSALSRVVMILLIAATIVFGVYPQPILNALKR
jgi:NADH:ubiquinone oxidoreductase subunit 4 (subunit M)